MKEEQMTYSTGDMLKLISTAATNLLLKEKKVSLEARIRKQREELEHTREFLTRARKRVAELAPEIMKAEESARESRERFTLLKTQLDVLKNERERLREIEKKAPLLQKMSAEIPALHENVDVLQDRYDRLRSVLNLANARKEGIETKRSEVMGDLQARKDKLACLIDENKQLTLRLSGICSVGYVKKFHAEEISLGETLGKLDRGSEDSEFPTSLIPFLQNARRVEVICRGIEEMNQEGDSRLSDFKTINDSGILKDMQEDINRQAGEFLAVERRKVQGLEKRKSVIDTAEDTLKRLKSDYFSLEEELRTEQEFEKRSKALLRELDNELTAQRAELERIKKEVETIRKDKRFTEIFTVAIGPSSEYLRNINKKLSALMEDYKRAFYGVAKVLKTL